MPDAVVCAHVDPRQTGYCQHCQPGGPPLPRGEAVPKLDEKLIHQLRLGPIDYTAVEAKNWNLFEGGLSGTEADIRADVEVALEKKQQQPQSPSSVLAKAVQSGYHLSPAQHERMSEMMRWYGIWRRHQPHVVACFDVVEEPARFLALFLVYVCLEHEPMEDCDVNYLLSPNAVCYS